MTDFPSYAYGAVTIAANGTVVTGTGTVWSGARAGDDLVAGGHTVIINDVTDDNHLAIDAWPYAALTDATYKIVYRSPLRFVGAEARVDLTLLLSTLKAKGLLWYLDPAYATPDDAAPPLTADDGQAILKIATGELWVMQGGAWTTAGTFKGFNFTGAYDSGATYNINDVFTDSGNAYIVTAAPPVGTAPPNASYYAVLASKGDTGAAGVGVGYVSSRADLASRTLDSTRIYIMLPANEPALWSTIIGDFSYLVSQGDQRVVPPSSDPTGASGAFVAIGSVTAGEFYTEDGALIQRLNDRVFIGGATLNDGKEVAANADWLTQFQMSTGRPSGFIQTSQSAILTAANAHSLSALTLAAQSVNSPGDFIGAAAINGVGVSNCTTYSAGAWAGYFEAYRMAGTAGAVGVEIDVINFASESGTEPFTQSTGQTGGLQLGAGGGLPSTGQYSISAAINVRTNGSTFARGFVFGNDSIKGTDGTTGAGEVLGLATGHVINYYYGSGTVSWTLGAGFGVDGDYSFTSQGAGSVSVPSLKTPKIIFPATQVPSSDVNTLDDYEEGTFTPSVTFGGVSTGVTYSKQVGKYTKIGNRVDAALEIILTSKGTATGALNIAGLPFVVTAALSPVAGVRCANLDSSFSTQPAGIFVSGQSSVNLAKIVAGVGASLTDTDITNTTIIRVSGTYFVD